MHNLISPDFAAAWSKIGIQLGIPLGILNSIEAGFPTNISWCCDQMLEYWVELEPNPSWGKIIEAIDSPAVKYFMDSFSSSRPFSENTMSKVISSLACQLQVKAIKSRFKTVDDDWPLSQPKHFTDLVFVYHKTGKTKKEDIERIASFQHKGRISSTELAIKNSDVKHISDIFTQIKTKDGFQCPEKILIEGAPGIGKTTLAKEIVFRWANGDILKDKKLVILVYLRDPKAQRICTLEDFVTCFCSHTDDTNVMVKDYIKSTKGKDMVIILDGYDEIPERIISDQDSFFKNLINQNVDHLINCIVVITSRHTESARLNDVVDRRIEILGFTDKNRKEYIAEALNGENDKIKYLQEYLDKNPAINAHCYVPLNMTILLHLYTGSESSPRMPKTQTQIYKKFICIIIAWFIKKKGKYCSIPDFSKVPPSYQLTFRNMCKLAFVALQKNKVVLTKKDIEELSDISVEHSENCSGLGLLKAVKFLSIKENSEDTLFSFLHLSVQEILAAYHITLLPRHKQLQLLHNNFWETRYYNMWIMYVGLTDGQSFEFRHFLSPYPFKIFTRLSFMLSGIPKFSRKIIEDKCKCLYLFQCFLETQRDEMNHSFGQFLKNGEIDVSSQILSAINIHTLGFFLARIEISRWKLLNLSECHIENTGLNRLLDSFTHNCYRRSMIHIEKLNAANNNLTNDSIPVLLELILTWNIQSIDISLNEIDNSNLVYAIINIIEKSTNILSMKVEVLNNSYSTLVIYNATHHVLVDAVKNYSCICALKCEIKSNTNEFLNSVLQKGKDVYLYRNKLPLQNIIATVKVGEFSSLHYTEEDFSYADISSIVATLITRMKFAFQINTTFPLHIINVTLGNIIVVKNILKQKNTSGTFLFKGCIVGHVHEIVSSVPLDTNIKLFHLNDYNALANIDPFVSKLFNYDSQESEIKKIFSLLICRQLKHLDMSFTCITGKAANEICKVISNNNNEVTSSNNSEVISTNMNSLEYLNLCNCKIHKKDIQLLCNAIKSNTTFSSINLSNNTVTDQAAFLIGETFSKNIHLRHAELANCNLSKKGLQMVLGGMKENRVLQTINFSLNNIGNKEAHSIAAILSNNNMIECIYLQDCSLSCDALNQITVAASSLKLLKSLDFSHNTIPDQSAMFVSDIIKTNHLEYLNLCECALTETGVQSISRELAHSQNLVMINLSGIKISDLVADSLTLMIANSVKLEKLCMSNCHLQSSGFTKICESLRSLSTLTHIDLSFNTFNYIMACSLAETIVVNSKLSYIDLSYCELKDKDFILILEAMKNTKNFKHLNLKNNKLDSTASDTLAKVIANNELLEYLCLHNCNLENDNLLKLFKSVNHSLTHLDVGFNRFTSKLAPKLIHVISANCNLKHVSLSNCGCDEGTLKQLCMALKEAKNLKFIDLASCCIDHDTARFLADTIITNNTLEALILPNCRMTHEVTKSLLIVLDNMSSLRYLNLKSNHLSNEGATKLASVIESNPVEFLDISNCSLQTKNASILFNSMIENPTLRCLDLSHNNLSNEIASKLSNVLATNTRLTKLNLTGNTFNTDSIELLLVGLSKINYLKKINLGSYQFNNKLNEAVNAMCSINEIKCLEFKKLVWQRNELVSLKFIYKCFSALQSISVSHVKFCEEDIKILSFVILNNQTIYSLSLTDCVISTSGKVEIFSSLHTIKMKYLILDGLTIVKEIEDLVATLVSKSINLKELTLSRCNMQCSATVKIAHALKNHHNLTHLNISHNTLTNYCISELSTAMADLTSLEFLSLSNCMVKVSAVEFSKMIPTARLKHLDLSNNQILSSEVDLIAMLIAGNVHLQYLNLSNCKLQSAGIESITEQFEKLKSLKHLDLSMNTLTDKAACDISRLIDSNPEIKVVRLSNSLPEYNALKANASLKFEINKRKKEFVAIKVYLHNLEYIRIKGQEWKGNWLDNHNKIQDLSIIFSQRSVSDDVFTTILKFLSKNHNQQTELAITDMDKNRSLSLFKVLGSMKSLKYLDVSNSDIPIDIIDTFVNAIKVNNKLEKLYLHDCQINKPVIEKMASALKTITTLKCLDLHGVKINDRAVEIADVITNNLTIEHLNLCSCKLFESDVEIIAISLQKLTNLKYLNLSDNDVTNHAAEELSTAIGKNLTIEYLNLSNCKLKETEIVAIGSELQKIHTLKDLDLGSNEIINRAADVIVNVIYNNTTMKNITLCNCNLTEPDDEKIFRALKVITSLETINLSHNTISGLRCFDLEVVLTSNSKLTYVNLNKCRLMRTEMAAIKSIKQPRNKKLSIKL